MDLPPVRVLRVFLTESRVSSLSLAGFGSRSVSREEVKPRVFSPVLTSAPWLNKKDENNISFEGEQKPHLINAFTTLTSLASSSGEYLPISSLRSYLAPLVSKSSHIFSLPIMQAMWRGV